MDEEIGKWFLDIAKYIITGYVIARMFGEDSSVGIIILAIVATVVLFLVGLAFIKKEKIIKRKGNDMDYGLVTMYVFLIVFALGTLAYSKISDRWQNKKQ